MKKTKLTAALFATAAVQLIIILIALNFLPEKIPAHFDLNMNIDRWGSKYESLLMPAASALMSAFMYGMSRFAAKQENGESNQKVILICGIAINIFFTAITLCSLKIAFDLVRGTEINGVIFVKAVFILLGAVIAVTGNFMPKCRLNSVIGLRTKWSMANEDVWFKCQRFGGVLFVVCGIMMLLVALLADSIMLILAVNIIIVTAAAAGSVIVSKLIYDRQQESGAK